MSLNSTYDASRNSMHPEEKAREKIDKQLRQAGWEICARDEYVPGFPGHPRGPDEGKYRKRLPPVY